MRPPARFRAAAVLVGVIVIAAACSSSSDRSAPQSTPATVATTTTTTPAVDCGNPVASFAPTGPEPAAASMPSGTYMAEIQQRGRLIAGVSADTLLFGYRNPLSGNLEGFDIDLVRQVAQAIFGDPNRVEYKVLTYAQRIPALTAGTVDIVADVMTVNCVRWQQISFSSQYFDAGQKILVRTDSVANGIAELDGKRMCAANGSTNIDNLKNYPKIKVVPVDDISDCMVLFQQGAVESVTGDDTVLAGFVAQDPYAKIVGAPLTSEPYGLGIARTHPEFVQFVNRILQRLRVDGTWKQMYARWLRPTGPVPEPPPALYGRNP
jgi:ABC-type amino acid transport/signal transduction systems, periplasmic component/domain